MWKPWCWMKKQRTGVCPRMDEKQWSHLSPRPGERKTCGTTGFSRKKHFCCHFLLRNPDAYCLVTPRCKGCGNTFCYFCFYLFIYFINTSCFVLFCPLFRIAEVARYRGFSILADGRRMRWWRLHTSFQIEDRSGADARLLGEMM